MKEIQPLLIAFAGPAHVGKDYVAEKVKQLIIANTQLRYPNQDVPIAIEIRGFADNMKEILSESLNIDKKWFYDPVLKEIARPLLQAYPEFMKYYHDDRCYWTKMYEEQLNHSYPMIYLIKDARFDQEADMILRYNGRVVLIESHNYETTEHASHISEAGVSKDRITDTFFNSRDIDEHTWNETLMKQEFFAEIVRYIEYYKDNV